MRSSLLAGIFVACGAHCGPSTVSQVRQYDTFENWDMILYLQKTFGLDRPMTRAEAKQSVAAFKRKMGFWFPEDQVCVAKCVYFYHELFKLAFPDSDFYFCERRDFSAHMPKAAYPRIQSYRDEMWLEDGTWINTDRLNDLDFGQVRPLVESYHLKWNPKAIAAMYASNGHDKYAGIKRMNR